MIFNEKKLFFLFLIKKKVYTHVSNQNIQISIHKYQYINILYKTVFCMVEKQLLLFSISLKIESKLKEINSKMSYFDKKRHF